MSGHRLSTAEIESALVAHTAVAEAAVIAVSDESDRPGGHRLRHARPGRRPAVLRSRRSCASTWPSRIGKLARPKRIIWADDLPKTRSGKIMRRLLRDIAEGREPGDATTLG